MRASPGAASGQPPAGGPPGGGTEATGEAATKATAAALAKYTGTVEHVQQLTDGSFVVHVITDAGEKHVPVTKAYAVSGLDTAGSGAGGPGAPPAGAPTAPAASGSAPS